MCASLTMRGGRLAMARCGEARARHDSSCIEPLTMCIIHFFWRRPPMQMLPPIRSSGSNERSDGTTTMTECV